MAQAERERSWQELKIDRIQTSDPNYEREQARLRAEREDEERRQRKLRDEEKKRQQKLEAR
jgi:hypothetical protein